MFSIKRCVRIAFQAVFVIVCIAGNLELTCAQSDVPPKQVTDVQQLKERIKLLEDTVQELKRQMATVEENQKPAATTTSQISIASSSAGTPTVIPAVLRTTPSDPPAATVPKKVKQDGENTLEIYGFAMLDTGYQFKSNHPDWFDVVRPTKLPAFEGEFDPEGRFFMGVRQSRLGVKTSTATKLGELKTIFEFELFGTGAQAGQTTFRIRHAYGELGQFGAGQYWTMFGDTDAYPNTFEYWGPNGLVWFRNVQFRWMPLKGRNAITIGIEKPGASGDQGVYADRIELAGIKPKLQWPDLVGNVRYNRGWGHVQISGVLRRIAWEDINDKDQFDFSGAATGGGVSVSSHFNFGEKDIGRFQFTYGAGIQNYMNDAPVDIGARFTGPQVNPLGPQVVPQGGTLQPPVEGAAIPVFGMSTFLDHTWSKKFTSSFGYSMLNMENTSAQSPGAYRQGKYFIANLLYYPVENFVLGAEYQWGQRTNFHDTFSSDDSRIQFSFRYNFSKVFKW